MDCCLKAERVTSATTNRHSGGSGIQLSIGFLDPGARPVYDPGFAG